MADEKKKEPEQPKKGVDPLAVWMTKNFKERSSIAMVTAFKLYLAKNKARFAEDSGRKGKDGKPVMVIKNYDKPYKAWQEGK